MMPRHLHSSSPGLYLSFVSICNCGGRGDPSLNTIRASRKCGQPSEYGLSQDLSPNPHAVARNNNSGSECSDVLEYLSDIPAHPLRAPARVTLAWDRTAPHPFILFLFLIIILQNLFL